ncbi:MAG: hypothetical protein LBS24_07415 [Clostridiales Family XIII bacterium]|jgi:hypothetical protein|nr:hypothetical protein [Clostridiales Family XIII bacterium]
MTINQQIHSLIDLIPDADKRTILDVLKRFIPDDVATPEDLATHEAAIAAFNRGECVRHEDMNWD